MNQENLGKGGLSLPWACHVVCDSALEDPSQTLPFRALEQQVATWWEGLWEATHQGALLAECASDHSQHNTLESSGKQLSP